VPGINRIPLGLLDLLGLKQLGRNPDQQSPTLAMTLDLERFYAINASESINISNAAINACGQYVASAAVPAGEVWLCIAAGFQWQNAAAGTTVAGLALMVGSQNVQSVGQLASATAVTDFPASAFWPSDYPFLMVSGQSFGVSWQRNTTGVAPLTLFGTATILRLRV
jgi:hypothetical protein